MPGTRRQIKLGLFLTPIICAFFVVLLVVILPQQGSEQTKDKIVAEYLQQLAQYQQQRSSLAEGLQPQHIFVEYLREWQVPFSELRDRGQQCVAHKSTVFEGELRQQLDEILSRYRELLEKSKPRHRQLREFAKDLMKYSQLQQLLQQCNAIPVSDLQQKFAELEQRSREVLTAAMSLAESHLQRELDTLRHSLDEFAATIKNELKKKISARIESIEQAKIQANPSYPNAGRHLYEAEREKWQARLVLSRHDAIWYFHYFRHCRKGDSGMPETLLEQYALARHSEIYGYKEMLLSEKIASFKAETDVFLAKGLIPANIREALPQQSSSPYHLTKTNQGYRISTASDLRHYLLVKEQKQYTLYKQYPIWLDRGTNTISIGQYYSTVKEFKNLVANNRKSWREWHQQQILWKRIFAQLKRDELLLYYNKHELLRDQLQDYQQLLKIAPVEQETAIRQQCSAIAREMDYLQRNFTSELEKYRRIIQENQEVLSRFFSELQEQSRQSLEWQTDSELRAGNRDGDRQEILQKKQEEIIRHYTVSKENDRLFPILKQSLHLGNDTPITKFFFVPIQSQSYQWILICYSDFEGHEQSRLYYITLNGLGEVQIFQRVRPIGFPW